MLTRDEVVKVMPPTLKSSITQSFVDTINNISTDPIFAEQVQENFITYANVLRDGKYKTTDYINAIVYVSFKLMNFSNEDAYANTFPQKYQDLVSRGVTKKDISSYVSAYNKGKLVNAIMEQSMVPTWVLNQHAFQKAINVQIDLMQNATSEKVRTDAANSILTHLKRPEAVKGQLDITINDNSGMNELKNTLAELAQKQIELIEGGASAKEIAAMPLIEGEVIEND